jgi:hypothetical protein
MRFWTVLVVEETLICSGVKPSVETLLQLAMFLDV